MMLISFFTGLSSILFDRLRQCMHARVCDTGQSGLSIIVKCELIYFLFLCVCKCIHVWMHLITIVSYDCFIGCIHPL